MLIQSLQNPFRDWNAYEIDAAYAQAKRGFKASKTLLGIETGSRDRSNGGLRMIQSLQNPFRDWNPLVCAVDKMDTEIQSLQNPFRDWNRRSRLNLDYRFSEFRRFKASKTLLGIETTVRFKFAELHVKRFKASKTLLGIETR